MLVQQLKGSSEYNSVYMGYAVAKVNTMDTRV